MNEEQVKKAVKEAVKEWLDDVYRSCGRWTLRALFAALVAGMVYMALTFGGWQKIPNLPTNGKHGMEVHQ